MRFVADLHIHSKNSRATSRDCDLEHLAWWGARKGIALLGTGDFTHPGWFAEIQEKLVAAEPGLYRLNDELERGVLASLPPSCRTPVRFMLSVEISTIYKRDEKTRKVHHLVYMPNFEAAAEFNKRLGAIGNIRSDGRPILGLDSRHLLEITLETGGYLVPAHVWTPWFAVLGSQSGFDAVDDCYADLAPHIFALETGLSSDPAMNWRVSSLDRFRLVSNSDAHSPPALGREATLFDTELDYYSVRRALETGAGLTGTLEFFPEEGKYHLDGHRKCDVRWMPTETIAQRNMCSGCAKPVTVGVMHRVEKLADRPDGFKVDGAAGFTNLVQLAEIVSEIHGVGPKSKRVTQDVMQLSERLGPELLILQDVPIDDIATQGSSALAEAIRRLRLGEVIREGGFDGEYGVIRMFHPGELTRMSTSSLFDMAPVTKVKVAKKSKADSDPAPVVEEIAVGEDLAQRQAIETLDGPVVVVAGPGTGKTHTIAQRFAELITKGVDPSRCLAVTFTRRACDELRERLSSGVTVTTFHGLGLRILREHAELVGLSEEFRVIGDLEIDAGLSTENSIAINDLLALPIQLLQTHPEIQEQWSNRFDHIAIDEYQDIDELQYTLIRLLTSANSNLCVVGDPDQAIYGFRGANVGFFMRFGFDFPAAKTITLTRNYRSTATIVETATQTIAPSTMVPERKLESVFVDVDAPLTVSVRETNDETDEAEFITATIEEMIGGTSLYSLDSGRADSNRALHLSFSDIAVLCRTNNQFTTIAEAFGRAGIPAQIRSHNRLIDHEGVIDAIKAIVSLEGTIIERIAQCARVDVVELLTPLAADCGDDLGRFLTELSMGAEVDTWDPRADRVSLLTMHAAKGLEFPVVFVAGMNDGLVPMNWKQSDLDEERRLLFVAMTRAKSHLFLSHSKTRKGQAMKPSRFLKSIGPGLLNKSQSAEPVRIDRQLKLL